MPHKGWAVWTGGRGKEGRKEGLEWAEREGG